MHTHHHRRVNPPTLTDSVSPLTRLLHHRTVSSGCFKPSVVYENCSEQLQLSRLDSHEGMRKGGRQRDETL